MICTAILFFKCFCANLQMGRARVRAGSRPPEDKPLFPKSGEQDFTGKAKVFSDDKK